MDSYQQQIIELYTRRTNYDHELNTRHPHDANVLLKSVPIHPGQKILDIATGTGLVAIPAAQKVGSEGFVTGVDITSGMLAQARRKIADLSLQNIELIEADANTINFADSSFDAIFCCEAIVWFPNTLATLQRWYRFLKPGGFVAFTCPSETAYLSDIYKNIGAKFLGKSLPHILEPLGTPERCHQLLQQAGFKDIEVKIEPSERYRHINDNKLSSTAMYLSFKGNPLLLNLSASQINQLQTDYQAEIEQLTTKQGVLEDTTNFFVRARK
jgi:ubiquinone/menaquinone biosynthesis C-methylase UbiE